MTLESKLQVAENLRQTLHNRAKQNKQEWWKRAAKTQELLQDFSVACNGLEKSVRDLVEIDNCEVIRSALDSMHALSVSGKELDFGAEFEVLNNYIAYSQTLVHTIARGEKLQAEVGFDDKTLVGKAIAKCPARVKAYVENIGQLRHLREHFSTINDGTTKIPGAMYVLAVRNKMAGQMPLYSPAGVFLGDGRWRTDLVREDGIAAVGEVKTGLLGKPPAVMRCEYSPFSIGLSLSPTLQKESLFNRAGEAGRNRQFVVECFVMDNLSRAGIKTLFTEFVDPNYLPFCWNFKDNELMYNQGDAKARLFRYYFDPNAETDGLRAYLDELKEAGGGDSLLSLGASGDSFSLAKLRGALKLNEGDVVKLLGRAYGRPVDRSGDVITLIGE